MISSIPKTNQRRNHSYDLSSAQSVKKKKKKVWLLEKAALASFHLSFTALVSKSLPLIKVKAGHFSVLRNKATQTKWKQASSEWAQSSVKRLQCSQFSATSDGWVSLSTVSNGLAPTSQLSFSSISLTSLSAYCPPTPQYPASPPT